MPKLNGNVPKYRKHRASGQAVVNLNGKDHYLGPHGTKASEIEYDRLVGEWLGNGRQPVDSASEELTVTEVCALYLAFAKTYYIKNGKPTDEIPGLKIAIRLLRRTYGKTLANDFGPLRLIAMQNHFIKAGHSRRYVNQSVGRIKRIFKWAVSRELIDPKVRVALESVTGLKKGKTEARETPPVLPVDDDVVDKTVDALTNRTTADMVRIQRLLGCRPGELFIMRPRDIDRDGGGFAGVWLYHPESHKMEHKERHRVIVIGPKAQVILAPYLLKGDDEFCFVRRCGKKYERWHYSQQIQWACDKAFPVPDELPEEEAKVWKKQHRWAPNRLRHSAGTEIRKKHGIEGTKVVLGHANTQTSEIYAERDLEAAVRIMSEVG